jgi:hypothetical protein
MTETTNWYVYIIALHPRKMQELVYANSACSVANPHKVRSVWEAMKAKFNQRIEGPFASREQAMSIALRYWHDGYETRLVKE